MIYLDFLAIGNKIKELRKQLGLSQRELSRDICTQAQISKIEKGDVYPYASTLYFISERLGVDVNYFFDIGTTPRLDYVLEVGRQLKLARRSLDYVVMREIVKTEEKNPLFTQNRRNMQLLLWHKGIYQYELHKRKEKAFALLDEAIALTYDKVWTEKEIEILLSKGIIFFEERNYQEALNVYVPALDALKGFTTYNDDTIMSRLLYSTARVHTRLGQYQDSTSCCKQAIDWCLERDNLYLLGELHYHIGYNFELQSDIVQAKACMKKALIIFELQKDDKYISFISNKITEWS